MDCSSNACTTRGVLAAALMIVGLAWAAGCGGKPTGDGPFGRPLPSVLLKPFEGNWKFDFDKTIETRRAEGASDAEVEQLRQQHAHPHEILARIHPDITIVGNEAIGSGMLSIG
jgi:hypothetical protein